MGLNLNRQVRTHICMCCVQASMAITVSEFLKRTFVFVDGPALHCILLRRCELDHLVLQPLGNVLLLVKESCRWPCSMVVNAICMHVSTRIEIHKDLYMDTHAHVHAPLTTSSLPHLRYIAPACRGTCSILQCMLHVPS